MTLTATRVRMLTPVGGGLWPALVTGRIEQALRSASNQMKMPLASVRVSNRSSPIRRGCSIRRKKWQYSLYIAIFVLSLHPQTERGALVQPVRIRACHARGQGFESPTHRNRRGQIKLLFDLPPSIACTVRLPHNGPDCIQGPREPAYCRNCSGCPFDSSTGRCAIRTDIILPNVR